jgi:CP family cyanate transporter-like MFS transporter
VLQEVEHGLGVSSGAAGVITALPVLCFAVLGFAAPPLSARFRDAHVLTAALLAMAAGLVLRALAGSFAVFVVGTVVAMVGGALGNVMLPGLVKRWFPARTGLLVGAYSTAMSTGGAVAAVSTAPIAAAAGPDGWRWALGVWAVPAVVAGAAWLLVRPAPGARPRRVAVRLRPLARSRMAVALAVFFGLQAIEAYVVVGWSAQYLRDAGLSAAAAGLALGLNSVVVVPVNAVVPALAVRPHLQRPLLAGFVACYLVGWGGLWLAPLAAPWLWLAVLALGMGAFAMVLTLLGVRARTAETTAALSTFSQGWGYLLSVPGPLLVGVLRGVTGGYTGMFVVVLVGVAGLAVSGWLATADRTVDDDLPGWAPEVRPATPAASPRG